MRFACKLLPAAVLCAVLWLQGGDAFAQVAVYEDFVPELQHIYKKERFVYAVLHTGGGTLGYEQGRLSRRFHYSGWNVEISTQLNPYAKKVNYYGAGRSYRYGLLNSFGMLRAGYGGEAVFTDKPYGGGVRVGFTYRGGFSLGFAFPQWVYVIYDGADMDDIRLEKMSADNPRHKEVSYVVARGPLLKGFDGMRVYPGAYAKAGLNFEFGKVEEYSHNLGFGVMYDCYFRRVPLMMERKNPIGFMNFYIEYKFGMRYGRM